MGNIKAGGTLGDNQCVVDFFAGKNVYTVRSTAAAATYGRGGKSE